LLLHQLAVEPLRQSMGWVVPILQGDDEACVEEHQANRHLNLSGQ
jgi:hypothetical protein